MTTEERNELIKALRQFVLHVAANRAGLDSAEYDAMVKIAELLFSLEK